MALKRYFPARAPARRRASRKVLARWRSQEAYSNSRARRRLVAPRFRNGIPLMSESNSLMVSVSGIRGRVGEGLTPEVVARFAAGFGAWSARQPKADGRIVVGRDSRVSGPMFHRAVVAALQSVG